MGCGIGVYCVRCGGQLSYDDPELFNEELKVCGYCIKELKKRDWDRDNQEIIGELLD